MVDRNLLYLSFAIASLVWCRCLHIPSVLACESNDPGPGKRRLWLVVEVTPRGDIRAKRREVTVFAWMFGGWALSTLELFYDAQSLMALVVAAAVTAVATRTALDYVQLLRWVDHVCPRGT